MIGHALRMISAEAAMTPRARSSAVSVSNLFSAPRSLNAPGALLVIELEENGVLRQAGNVSECVHGEIRMSARILLNAA